MISIVIPCFNEELIINDFIDELSRSINEIEMEFEVIFIDNKSNDQTLICDRNVLDSKRADLRGSLLNPENGFLRYEKFVDYSIIGCGYFSLRGLPLIFYWLAPHLVNLGKE